MRSLIVHNQASGFGSGAIFEFQRELLQPGDECVVRTLAESAPIVDVLRDAEGFDVVVLSGGDGTVTNALYAMRERGVTICVFPTGTANLFFANIGNASEPTAIAAACRTGNTHGIDLGELHWIGWDGEGEAKAKGFALMSGMGFDAQLMADARERKQLLGEAAYFAAALNNLKPRVVSFDIEVDGERFERQGISCIVANTSTIQGDISLLPGCRMDDGLLDLMVLSSPDAVQLLLPIMAGIVDPAGELLGRPHIEHFQGRRISVHSSEPLHAQRDGDVMEGLCNGFEAVCLPAANQVVVDRHSSYF